MTSPMMNITFPLEGDDQDGAYSFSLRCLFGFCLDTDPLLAGCYERFFVGVQTDQPKSFFMTPSKRQFMFFNPGEFIHDERRFSHS